MQVLMGGNVESRFDSVFDRYDRIFSGYTHRTRTGADHRPDLSITNDMPEAGGGASTSAAPVAAATDDDGGDPDPEPERRRACKTPSPRAAQRNGTATAADLIPPPTSDDALWRLPTVLQHYPVSRSSWWAGVKSGRYPSPIRISSRCVAWKSTAIRDLINSL